MPPPLPPTAKKSSGQTALILGCAGILLLGATVLVIAAAWWFISSRNAGKGGSSGLFSVSGKDSSSDNGLGVGAEISQYKHAGGSACVIGPDGAWHAVFQEKSTYGKPVFIYHRTSRDGGRTWSAPIAISDDGTGNGSGYPQMGKDNQGNVFAAWVRFGQGGMAAAESTLDGPGGYVEGTLMLRRWNGSGWDGPMTVGSAESVCSFCMYNALDGSLKIVWGEKGGVILECPTSGGNATQIVAAGVLPTDNATYGRPGNLAAWPDNKGGVILLAELKTENTQQLILWHDGQYTPLAADPKYQTRNTFNFPAQLFADASGRLHIVYIPYPQGRAQAELWDIDPTSGQHTVIFSGKNGKETIERFQLVSDGRGTAHVALQVNDGNTSDATDIAALSFAGGVWSQPRGLTGNSRAESFFQKDLPGGDVAVLSRYYAKHTSMALDASGKVHALATIDCMSSFSTGSHQVVGGQNYNVVSGASVSEPSVYVLPWR